MKQHVDDSLELARRIRRDTVEMIAAARASHIGSCLSIADILAVLYAGVMRHDPSDPSSFERDRLILSKGHATAILYAVLAETGYFDRDELLQYCAPGSRLLGHASHKVPGVELSTGSLGHGLSVAAGMAIDAKRKSRDNKIFVILSDGELDEGSNWEALLFAPQHQLDNLVAIVDYNKIQSFGSVAEVLQLEPLAAKMRAFRWAVHEVDGHDHQALWDALTALPKSPGKPTMIIAHTVKGKGVSFMEHQLLWHYRSPNPEQSECAIAEIEKT